MSRALQINSSPQGWMARNTKPVPLAEKGWVITMKKISIILLSAVLVFSMAACNGGKEKADNQTEKQTESVKPTKEAEMALEQRRKDGDLRPELIEKELEVPIKVVESNTKTKARLNLANLLNIKTPPKLVEGERGLFRKLRKDPTFLRDR